jgi:hypothetical protein
MALLCLSSRGRPKLQTYKIVYYKLIPRSKFSNHNQYLFWTPQTK